MCGRYILAEQTKAEKAFDVERQRWHGAMSYNVAPGRDVPVIRMNDGVREGVMMRWGLIPHFLKGESPKYPTSNARLESMETSPAFRDPWKKSQRCLVPADGFYEWHQPVGRPKQPWFVGLANKEAMAFAGLWDQSKKPDGTLVESVAIITLSANEFMAKIDNEEMRMPAILEMQDIDVWLNGSPQHARAALVKFPGDRLRAYRVGPRVNSPKNDDAALLEEVSGTG